MSEFNRRQFLTQTSLMAASMAVGQKLTASPNDNKNMTLGFSLYGMLGVNTEVALKTVSDIGYDSVELCLMDQWETTPLRMGPKSRASVKKTLEATGLKLSALMEHVILFGSKQSQYPVKNRLERAAELGHDLSPDQPPIIETTAGGGPWEKLKNQMRDNLGMWAEVGKKNETVIAIKPHRGGVIDHPDQGVWLVEQINSPWIRLNYDYSHFTHREIPLEESMKTMMPYTCFIHVKDTVKDNGKVRFVLPGKGGNIDYVRLLKLAKQFGYHGDICCEVSGMVFKQKGYDPVEAAKFCYENLSMAFEKAGIQRG